MAVSVQRLSGWILAGVSIFALFVVGILVIRGYLAPESGHVSPTKADYRIKDIRLHEQHGGRLQWRLVADKAEVFSQEGRTLMRKVTVTIEAPDRTWTVTGDEGDLHEATKDVEIRKNVVLTSSDGLRLQTDTLRWQAKERRVWTDDPVTIFREGAVIQGQGLETWMADERTQVKGRLRVTFPEGSRERSQ